MLTQSAPLVWNNLKGIICVYKPVEQSCTHIRNSIIHAICSDLNSMECRPPRDYVSIDQNIHGQFTVIKRPNYADDPLICGPRYDAHRDLKCSWSNYLGRNTSGVLLLGLRDGTRIAKFIRENKPNRTYRVSGCLGRATEGAFQGEKIVEKTTWKHVKRHHMDQMLSNIQSSHQREMYRQCGVDLQSQTAYELAVQGLVRPSSSKIPMIYGISCVEFEPPNFVLELNCINEYETYLKMLIQDLGIKLHSSAHCTGIQCIRHGHFTVDDALLRKHWKLKHIVENMKHCSNILAKYEDCLHQTSPVLKQHSENLLQPV